MFFVNVRIKKMDGDSTFTLSDIFQIICIHNSKTWQIVYSTEMKEISREYRVYFITIFYRFLLVAICNILDLIPLNIQVGHWTVQWHMHTTRLHLILHRLSGFMHSLCNTQSYSFDWCAYWNPHAMHAEIAQGIHEWKQ